MDLNAPADGGEERDYPVGIRAAHSSSSRILLLIGELNRSTDAWEVQSELHRYGVADVVRFMETGEAVGYYVVQFHDEEAAALCKISMRGHVFGGRPCFIYSSLQEMQDARNPAIIQPPLNQMYGDVVSCLYPGYGHGNQTIMSSGSGQTMRYDQGYRRRTVDWSEMFQFAASLHGVSASTQTVDIDSTSRLMAHSQTGYIGSNSRLISLHRTGNIASTTRLICPSQITNIASTSRPPLYQTMRYDQGNRRRTVDWSELFQFAASLHGDSASTQTVDIDSTSRLMALSQTGYIGSISRLTSLHRTGNIASTTRLICPSPITNIASTSTPPLYQTTNIASTSTPPLYQTMNIASTSGPPLYQTMNIASTSGPPLSLTRNIAYTSTPPLSLTRNIASTSGSPLSQTSNIGASTSRLALSAGAGYGNQQTMTYVDHTQTMVPAASLTPHLQHGRSYGNYQTMNSDRSSIKWISRSRPDDDGDHDQPHKRPRFPDPPT